MKVNIIGLGYIGLPTALCMVAAGIAVTGTDKNDQIIETLRKGKPISQEKGIDPLFKRVMASGKLMLSNTCVPADIYILTVPTPYIKHSRKIDSSCLVHAVQDVLKVCPKDSIIAVESTVSPGTIDREIRPVIEQKGFICGHDLHIAHVPERIIPGNMIHELEHNNRIIGVDDTSVSETLTSLYRKFCKGEMVITDIKTAELTKVAENTFRDINIAYANEGALEGKIVLDTRRCLKQVPAYGL